MRVVDYGIRGMHLAYDLLDGYDALVIVDAVPGRTRAGDLTVLRSGRTTSAPGDFDPHGMNPVAVLASLGSPRRHVCRRTYVVGCRPASTRGGHRPQRRRSRRPCPGPSTPSTGCSPDLLVREGA